MRRPSSLVVPLAAVTLLAAACGGGGGGSKGAPPGKTGAAGDNAASPSGPPARKIVIMVDTARTEVMTTGQTVQQVLDQAHVQLGKFDLVNPAKTATPANTIKVTRLLSKPQTRTVKTDPPTVKKKMSSLPPFSQKELRKGRPEIKIVQTAWVHRRGKKVKAVIFQKLKQKAVPRILGVGPQSAAGGDVAKLNWAGLAKCESGGNPRSVNPAGYYGLYQFSLSSWASVGGSGKPSDAPAAEQTYRAQLLYKRVGGRWQGQWPNCGRFLFS
ncbi:resuscitation-promoting factor [Actinomadura oligospora]|uniref:resuscitation-promoting factor n=1 Tax=Actinomadura oligospora TaxID=111804 RepID=UPI0004790A67|nr:resuscitation-promoting factor [Actinomadura oligospora]